MLFVYKMNNEVNALVPSRPFWILIFAESVVDGVIANYIIVLFLQVAQTYDEGSTRGKKAPCMVIYLMVYSDEMARGERPSVTASVARKWHGRRLEADMTSTATT